MQAFLAQRPGFDPSNPLQDLPKERWPQPAKKRWHTLQELSSEVRNLQIKAQKLEDDIEALNLEQRPAKIFMELFVFAALVGLVVAFFGQAPRASIVTGQGLSITLILAVAMLFWIFWQRRH